MTLCSMMDVEELERPPMSPSPDETLAVLDPPPTPNPTDNARMAAATTVPPTTVGLVIGLPDEEPPPFAPPLPLPNVPPVLDIVAAELDNAVVAFATEPDAFCAAETAIFCKTCNLSKNDFLSKRFIRERTQVKTKNTLQIVD